MRQFWQTKLSYLPALVFAVGVVGCNSSEFLRQESRQVEEQSASLAPKVKRTNSFIGGKTQDGSVTVKPFFNEASSQVNLVNAIVDGNQAVTRPRIEKVRTFRQGQAGDFAKDEYRQDDYGVLDVLFVIDNSKSMKNEQKKLGSKLGSFLRFVGDSNWKVGLISTDFADGAVPSSFITRNTRNFRGVFENRVGRFGTQGSNDERGLVQAFRGITSGNWLRPDSSLAIVIVSDEDECSIGSKCKTGNITATRARDRLVDFLAKRGNAKIYGLITPKKFTYGACSFKSGGNRVGAIYKQAINSTGGVFGSICDRDYDDVLSKISRGVQNTLRRQYRLSHTPIGGSLKIFVGDKAFTGKFRRSGRTVTLLSNLPSKGSRIRFEYRHGASTITKRFAFDNPISADFLSVFIDGNEVPRGEWELVDGRFIDFVNAPGASKDIVVRYRNRGQRFGITFNNPKYVRGSLRVKLNGKAFRDYRFENGRISFGRAIRDNSSIALSYKLNNGAKLRYPFRTNNGRITLKRAYYRDRPDSSIPVIFENEELVVPSGDFRAGQRLIVETFENQGDNDRFDLGRSPIANTATITVLSGRNCDANDFNLNDNWLTIDCPFSPDSEFQVDFKEFAQARDRFALDLVADEVISNLTVTVNDQPWTAFSLEGNIVTFTERAPQDSRVLISFESLRP